MVNDNHLSTSTHQVSEGEGEGGGGMTKTLKVMTDEALIRVKGWIDKMTGAELNDHWNWMATAEGEGSWREDVEKCFAAAKVSYIFVLDRKFKCLRTTQGSGSGSSPGVAKKGQGLRSSSRAQTEMDPENAGKRKISNEFIDNPGTTLWSPSKKMRDAGSDQASLGSEVPERQQRDSDSDKTLQKANSEMTKVRRSHRIAKKKNRASTNQAETETGEEEVIDIEVTEDKNLTLANSAEEQQRHVHVTPTPLPTFVMRKELGPNPPAAATASVSQVKQCMEGREEREEGGLDREKKSFVVVVGDRDADLLQGAKQIEVGVEVNDLTEEKEVIDPDPDSDPGDQQTSFNNRQMMETQNEKDAESGNKTLETNRSDFGDHSYSTANPKSSSDEEMLETEKKTTSKIDRHCAFCLDPTPAEQVILCQGCGRRAYCSQKCREIDWLKSNGSITFSGKFYAYPQGHEDWCGESETCGEEDLDWKVVPKKVGMNGRVEFGLEALRDLPPLFRIMVGGVGQDRDRGRKRWWDQQSFWTVARSRDCAADKTGSPNAALILPDTYGPGSDLGQQDAHTVKILISERGIKKGEEILQHWNWNPSVEFDTFREQAYSKIKLKALKWDGGDLADLALVRMEAVIRILTKDLGAPPTVMEKAYEHGASLTRKFYTQFSQENEKLEKLWLTKRIEILAKIFHKEDKRLIDIRKRLKEASENWILDRAKSQKTNNMVRFNMDELISY